MAGTKNSVSTEVVAKIKDQIGKHVTAYFAATLAQEKDIVNIVAAQIYYESRFNFNALGLTVSSGPGTGAATFVNSSVVQKILKDGTPEQKNNIFEGLKAVGLSQVMGYYFVKGASTTGVCEIQRLRPDLAGTLCVDPGVRVYTSIATESNFSKSILAGLIILESKFKNVRATADGLFYVLGDRYNRTFPTKIAGAVAAYLGLGSSDRNTTTPESYSRNIVGGAAYKVANGDNPIIYKSTDKTAVQVAAGPATNGSTKTNIFVPGCA